MSVKKKAPLKIQNNKDEIMKDFLIEKTKVALKFINVILANLGKPAINSLTEFTDVDREDIIKEVNKKSFDDMQDELFSCFDKKKCGYYRKTDAQVLNCLRSMMKDLGYEMTYDQKDRYEVIDGKSYKRSHSFYSINLLKK